MALLGFALGCADGGLPTLTDKDVTGIPAGNALGTTYSGMYSLITSHLAACRCRAAVDCAALQPGGGGTFTVVEQDGLLSIDAPPCNGGVNRDGSFRCGTRTDGSTGTIAYAAAEGGFGSTNGRPSTFQAVENVSTFTTNGLVTSWTCDIRLFVTAVFVSP